MIPPTEEKFSAFVFKIQANMNKAHRDRIAFMRICSGKFDVLQFRMESEYGVKYNRIDTPLSIVRFAEITDGGDFSDLNLMSTTKHVVDRKGRDLLLFNAEYEINWALDKNKNLVLKEFSQLEEFE